MSCRWTRTPPLPPDGVRRPPPAPSRRPPPGRGRRPRSAGCRPGCSARWPGCSTGGPDGSCSRAPPGLVRIEVFDRSMTIAAQFFSSILPILILLAAWEANSDRLADAIDLPEESRSVIEGAIQGGDAAFGIVGTLFVLASATSLSRALTRAFATIWFLPRPRSSLRSAWRWLAVILVLALSLVVARTASQSLELLPPRELWPRVLSASLDVVGRGVRPVGPARRGGPDAAAAPGGAALRGTDADRPSGHPGLAPPRPRDQRRPVRLHRGGVHLPDLAVHRVLGLPGDRGRGPGDRHRPGQVRRLDPPLGRHFTRHE